MNSLIGTKNQLVHKGIQHLHVSKQATKISEIRLHYLIYKHKTQWKKNKKYFTTTVQDEHRVTTCDFCWYFSSVRKFCMRFLPKKLLNNKYTLYYQVWLKRMWK